MPTDSMIPPAGLRGLLRVISTASWYPAALITGTVLVDVQPATRRAVWLAWASTDLHNLADLRPVAVHPVGSLLVSALVCEGDLLAWVVLSIIGLATLGSRIGAPAAAAVVFTVHLLATLVSQGVTAYRISAGALPEAARSMSDLGPSYLVVAALVAGVVTGRPLGRVLSGLGFAALAPSLFGGLTRLEVAPLGHLASIALAVPLGLLAVRYRDRQRSRSGRT